MPFMSESEQYHAMVEACLMSSFRAAAENFATFPTADHWNTLEMHMHARQYWHSLSSADREIFAANMASELTIGQWVPHMHGCNVKRFASITKKGK